MKKYLLVHGYLADGEVKKIKYGYDVVITISFVYKQSAESCLKRIHKLEEVANAIHTRG